MRSSLLLACLFGFALTASGLSPSTKANDDSCDIALLPAATLLLPYFETDFTNGTTVTTLFSITNVTNVSRVARVTLWTDYAYPVLSFNIYLTGYDVQSISLFDVIAKGIIGNGVGTGSSASHTGTYSDPDPQLEGGACADLPGRLPGALVRRMQEAFSLGTVSGTANGPACKVGNEHENAIGYATIDVVGNCSPALPTDPEYFTNDLRYDNVLIGDYEQLVGPTSSAQVNPMVHIRAIPEGGTPASRFENPGRYGNRFAHTFYGRFQEQATPTGDARQPLPSRFAVRWINSGPAAFDTSLKIWRQGVTGRDIVCTAIRANAAIPVADSVMFDENENAEGIILQENCEPIPCTNVHLLPATRDVSIADTDVFPHTFGFTRTAGWLYLNLDDGNSQNGAHQNWVVISMSAEGRYSGAMDAPALGNGCSAITGRAEENEGGSAIIGPSPNAEAEP
jgi:hypothetical protein